MATKMQWCDEPTMDPHDTRQLRSLIERRHYVTFCGRRTWVIPRLVDKVFGDGRKLLALYPMMFRPNHFVVRIDSSWITCNSDDQWPDRLDEIYDAIEDEFAEWPWAKRYGFTWHEDERADCDSRVRFDDGSVWCEMRWPRLED